MLTINILRVAYDSGIFPMAEDDAPGSEIFWCKPPKRAVFLPASFHVPRRLARILRASKLTIAWNDDFAEVIRQCGLQREEGSWISPEIMQAYIDLHKAGDAFCLSVFDGGVRVGGIYGVQRGGAFMAESMFSRLPNASSIALVVLMAGLVKAGVEIVDVQFENPHLTKFNPVFLTHKKYVQELAALINKPVTLKADYFTLATGASFVQSLSQTS